ncbi:myosin light chain kinase domain containing protein protein, putative [Babesia ovis]|uniref:Myosin light chain kinase domain containing protein protein, putative n=1 Tax=Babesia ovis TaxID=5869 RepID=A0A9W5WU13_BABOV|nr:myosin light chain kinase domain containing protein protein, putative [Babesia ovis]
MSKVQKSASTSKPRKYVNTYTAFIVALCLYMPDQITSVSSKHLTISLKVPAKNTGLYLTKMYGTKTLANFIASLLMTIVQMFVPADAWISCTCLWAVGIARLVLCVVYYLPNAAIWFYLVFIIHAFIRGLFENTFYPLAADHQSAISFAYKASRMIVWCLQVGMDVVIGDRLTLLITLHMLLMLGVSSAAVVTWSKDFITPPEQENEQGATGAQQPTTTPAQTPVPEPVKKPIRYGAPNALADENSFLSVAYRVYSPFLMVLVASPLTAFYRPGILPYSLVERRLCHPITLSLMLYSFIITMCIYFYNKTDKSMNNPWGEPMNGWHKIWLFALLPCLAFPIIYSALHYPTGYTYKMLHNNRTNVTLLSMLLITGSNVLTTMGFTGVSACSKDSKLKRGENALRIIVLASLLAQLFISCSYRLSTGYLMVRRRYIDEIANTAPTEDMGWLDCLCFWVSSTLKQAGRDFLDEFSGNIRDIVMVDKKKGQQTAV